MATLFHRTIDGVKSPLLTARFSIDGKRSQKETGLTKRREAQLRANEMEGELRRGVQQTKEQGAGLQKKWAAEIANAAREASEGRLTLDRAKDIVMKLHKMANPEFTEPSVEQVFDEWLDAQEMTGVAPSTMDAYRDAKRHLTEELGKAAKDPAHLITVRQIETAMAGRKKKNRAATVNLSFRVWRRVFKWALRNKTITANPTEDLKVLPEYDSVLRAPFTPTEAGAILDAADGEWKGLVLVGAHTALRLMDCARLEKSTVHDDLIVTMPGKTKRKKKVVHIPMTLQLRAWIEAQPKNILFPVLRTKSKQLLSGAFKDIMTKAGVAAQISLPGGEVRDRSFHSLRHSANSWLASGGVEVGQRMKVLGHADEKQNLAYTTMTAEDRRKTIAALPDLGTAAGG